MSIPHPVPIYRILHVDNLDTCLKRGALHAPLHTPNDGLPYKVIHNIDIQTRRRACPIPCGQKGTIHDYVAFYFGARSPMLYVLSKGGVPEYKEGQEPIIYLVTTVGAVVKAGLPFVFSDGHGIATFTEWFDSPGDLDKVDWEAINAHIWVDTIEDPDLQRRKQSEFLIHTFCPIGLIQQIGVKNNKMEQTVINILNRYNIQIPVVVHSEWYY